MSQTFDTVDDKVAEAEFFLRQMCGAGFKTFEFQCYLSAFLSAARTTTLALQRFQHIPGFQAWYEPHRRRLAADKSARALLSLRNEHVHGGAYPLSGFSHERGKFRYFFKDKGARKEQLEIGDIIAICRDHTIVLLEIIYDCYVALGPYIDPQQYYTKERFAESGLTIDDAELQIFGYTREAEFNNEEDFTDPEEAAYEKSLLEDGRWDELRGHLEQCRINHLFYSYLGYPTPQPVLPEELEEIAYTPEELGWTHIPAGFDSLEDYRCYRSQRPQD